MSHLQKNYRPGLVLACPLCYKETDGEPVQQLVDVNNILYCHFCGELPFIHAWPDDWPMQWLHFGCIPGDDGWEKAGQELSSTNGFPIVLPVIAKKKTGRDLDNLKKHLNNKLIFNENESQKSHDASNSIICEECGELMASV